MKSKELEIKLAKREGRIRDELIFQYDNLLHVLSVTIRPLSRKRWVSGAAPADVPVRQACHIAGSCDGYATHDWDICRRHFGIPVGSLDEDIPADRLPTTKQVLDYIDDVRQRVHSWLGEIAAAGLPNRSAFVLAPARPSHW